MFSLNSMLLTKVLPKYFEKMFEVLSYTSNISQEVRHFTLKFEIRNLYESSKHEKKESIKYEIRQIT